MKSISGSRFFSVWAVSTLVVLTLLVLLLGIFGAGELTSSRFFAGVFISGTVGLTADALYGKNKNVIFNLKCPRTVYGIFYILYYVLPFLGKLFRNQFEFGDESHLAIIIFLGAVCWHLGMHVSCHKFFPNNSGFIGLKAARALLVVLGISAGFVIYGTVWRIQEGIFFNQARYVELEATLIDSLRGVLTVQLQLPIILLLAMLASLRLRGLSISSKILFGVYSITAVLVLILASQTRPAITAMLFLVLGYELSSPIQWNGKKLSVLVFSSVMVVILVQGFRITQSDEFASSSNQLIYAVENIVNSTSQAVSSDENRTQMIDAVGSRSSAGIDFLGLVVQEIDARGQPFWGEGIFSSLEALVPRLFWPEKPAVVPMQILMQQMLGFNELYDAVPGPLIQFYFEGGLFGVVIGYAVLGLSLGWLTNRTFQSGAIGWWICLAFVWSSVANVEQEVVLGFAGAIRAAALMYGIWLLVRLVSKNARRPALVN